MQSVLGSNLVESFLYVPLCISAGNENGKLSCDVALPLPLPIHPLPPSPLLPPHPTHTPSTVVCRTANTRFSDKMLANLFARFYCSTGDELQKTCLWPSQQNCFLVFKCLPQIRIDISRPPEVNTLLTILSHIKLFGFLVRSCVDWSTGIAHFTEAERHRPTELPVCL